MDAFDAECRSLDLGTILGMPIDGPPDTSSDPDDESPGGAPGLIRERRLRLAKAARLRQLGYDPYPATSHRSHTSAEVLANFDALADEAATVTVTGRIRHVRNFGRLIFMELADQSGRIQLMVDQSCLTPADPATAALGFAEVSDLVDRGDLVGATGPVTTTTKGERSVLVTSLRMLTKALRPHPHRMNDPGDRQRRRYVDINVNPQLRGRYERRARFWEAHRRFFAERGFLEMNIPVLEHTTGGADAKAFMTHMDTIDTDFYLRISQELYLKRLIGAGYERVYEIGPRFRNEGIGPEHLPEHVAMELYWAYADYRDAMDLVRELFGYVAQEVWGRQRFTIRGFDVNLDDDWTLIDYGQAVAERFNLDVFDTSIDEVTAALQHHDIGFAPETVNVNRGIDLLWKSIRATIGGPAFMVHEPTFLSPLAKVAANPLVTQRFHPVIGGSELGNGYSELNDPVEQLDRFREQQALRDSGDSEAQMLDIDFIEMLEYGMAPTAGYGHSERNFWFFEGVTAREGVPFPATRHFVNPLNRAIFPAIELESNIYRAHRLPRF